MNRYLAICHALSLLEQPLTPGEYAAAVQPANPLFAGPCLTPQGFLLWLHEEGLLDQDPAPLDDPDQYRLNGLGQLLYQHLLNWTARDKAAITRQKAELRAASHEEPVAPDCPTCGSGFCAHYLFAVLLERLYVGLPAWNAWKPDEPALLAQALTQYFGARATRLSLLGETQALSQLLPTHQEALEGLLSDLSSGEAGIDPATIADFRVQAENRLLLPDLPGLSLPLLRIPRLRFTRGLMPPEHLQALRHLAYPQLFPREPGAPPRPFEDHFAILSRPGFDPERRQALLYLSDSGHDKLLILTRAADDQRWQLSKVVSAEARAGEFSALSGLNEA